MGPPSKKSRYSPHPSLAWARSVVEQMQARTGRSLEEWDDLVRSEGPKTEEGRASWLRTAHGLGTNYAAWIAKHSLGKGEDDADPEAYLARAEEYVEAQYAGPKAALRPRYERLLELGLALGPDVTASPCRTMVPLFRKHAILQIKAVTATRIDLGLALGAYAGKLSPRLNDTGGAAKRDRITHRIELGALSEVDAGVERWLRRAYELDT